MEHTKGELGLFENYVPYEYDYFVGFFETKEGRKDLFSVCGTKNKENRDDAIHLVRCWNNFDALLDSCKNLSLRLKMLYRVHKETCTLGEECPDKKLLELAEKVIQEAGK